MTGAVDAVNIAQGAVAAMPYVWPVVSALAGASTGAAATYWIQRPRITVRIDGIRSTAKFPDDTRSIIFDAKLISRIDTYDMPLAEEKGLQEIFRNAAPSEHMYVTALTQVLRKLEAQIDGNLPRLTKLASSLRQLVVNQEFKKFDRQIAHNSDELWSSFCSSLMHRDIEFPADAPDYTSSQYARFHEVQERQQEGDYPFYVIPLPGAADIVFTREVRAAHRQNVSIAARRVAYAIAYRNQYELLPFCDHLRSYFKASIKVAKELHADTQNAVDSYSRLVVSGILSNYGRTPISFTSLGRLTIELKGYRGEAGKVADDVDVPLSLNIANKAGPRQEPILVGPGAAIRFNAVSQDTFGNLQHASSLEAVFSGGSQKAYITVGLMASRDDEFAAIHSRPVLFRDLLQDVELPRLSKRPFDRNLG